MVVADLPAYRVTRDCGLVAFEPVAGWQAVAGAARQVAMRGSLPANWLNRIAIRNALDDREREGFALRHQISGVRNTRILLRQPDVGVAGVG